LTAPNGKKTGGEERVRTQPVEPAADTQVSAPEKRGRLSGWRALNSAIFLVAFIAPWLSACNGQIRGYETPFWLGLGTWSLFVRISRPEMWAEVPSYVLAPVILVGVLGVAVYAIANLLAAIFPRRATKLVRFPRNLTAGLIGMLASIIYVIGTGALMDLLWGYWLTWAGLVSSFALEVVNRRRGRSG
jgi:hypothetical protein